MNNNQINPRRQLSHRQIREIANLAKQTVLHGFEVTITATGNHIQSSQSNIKKIKKDAYGNKVFYSKTRILRPEYVKPQKQLRTLEELDRQYIGFQKKARAAYRQSCLEEKTITVGNHKFNANELLDYYRQYRRARSSWKHGYKFDYVVNQVKRLGLSERKISVNKKAMIERGFREFSAFEIRQMKKFRAWKKIAHESALLRAECFNHYLRKWKSRLIAEGLDFPKVQYLKPYKGYYNETYWHNRRNKFIPENAFDPFYYPKPLTTK